MWVKMVNLALKHLKNVRYVLDLECRPDKAVVMDKKGVSSKKVVRIIIAIILLRST